MLITLTPSDTHAQLLSLDYPREFSSASHLAKRSSSLATSWGNLYIQECWFEGACLFCSEFTVDKKAWLNLQCDSFCWLMNFVLEGELWSDTIAAPLQLKPNRYHTFYCSSLDMQIEMDQNTKVFTICLTRRFIRKLLGKDMLPAQFESGGPEPLTIVASDDFVNNKVSRLVRDIMEATQPEYIRRIFLEGKILELLSLQLEMLENRQTMPESVPDDDKLRLQRAKAIVEENIKTPCSLIELARKTGLNDFKLKKGFKALFGHTVFGYLTELRMEKAYLLLKAGKSVSEVAEIVGYKNPQHFTAAFKKKYGLVPRKINVQ